MVDCTVPYNMRTSKEKENKANEKYPLLDQQESTLLAEKVSQDEARARPLHMIVEV